MTPDASISTLWRRLTFAMLVYFALFVAHDVDHVVNEADLYELPTVFWILLPIQYGIGLAILRLVLRRDGRAPFFSAALGTVAAVGFVVVHALPFGIASYVDTDAGLFNWLLVFVPALVALYIAITGIQLHNVLRAPGPAATSGAS